MKIKTKPRRAILLAAFLAFAFAALSFFKTCHEKQILSADSIEHDFGRIPVKNGRAVGTHVFRIRNSS
ncbi:MAG: hypothetical protein LBG65_07735 [Puniceicoccales bacterium]|nr:hypothetical protein [Puniceicoccales bacterium]